MILRRLLAISTIALAACAPATTTNPPARPVPVPSATEPVRMDPVVFAEAPRNWQLLDEEGDQVLGIGLERARTELLAGREPKRTVVVAILDSGVDTAHIDLRANLWTNPDEIGGNARDDDGNGYVDDVRGWSFIGGPDGRNVKEDTYELTRLYVACTRGAQSGVAGPVGTLGPQLCQRVERDFREKRAEAEQILQNVLGIDAALSQALPVLREAAGTDSLTPERVERISSTRSGVQEARRLYLQLAQAGITPKDVEDAKKEFRTQLEYRYNTSFDPRDIVGDDYQNLTERHYGNADVMGPDAEHGTHVAGIMAAVRDNGIGIEGIAPAVRIMSVRTVPDGDERDKDVANAIRYAVDNGAHIINMSFGKAYSPQKSVVDEAVRYAASKGVLIVHAAGNDAEDVGQTPSYPTPFYTGGGRAANWIEVGASSWKGLDSLAAPFSNYGRAHVDVFAPGVDILSTVPGNAYERNSGTSMAAPVVTGVAAMLMAYYPELTAEQVRRIILESATAKGTAMVVRPGEGGDRIAFSELSATGGIVNAYAAVRMAERMAAGSSP